MIKGKTVSGFAYNIDDGALDDYELLETLCKVDKGEYGLMPEVIERLLGEEQRDLLKKHCTKESGRVSASMMMSEITEILQSQPKVKN